LRPIAERGGFEKERSRFTVVDDIRKGNGGGIKKKEETKGKRIIMNRNSRKGTVGGNWGLGPNVKH